MYKYLKIVLNYNSIQLKKTLFIPRGAIEGTQINIAVTTLEVINVSLCASITLFYLSEWEHVYDWLQVWLSEWSGSWLAAALEPEV